jgi:nucleoside-diphosphate-sugar epimerase
MSKFCVLGRGGLLGGAIARRLGDVTSSPRNDTRVIFNFASHVHPTFDMNPEYEMKQGFDSFSQLLPYCYERNILLVYPSSALVYEKDTQFSRFKKTLEHMASCYKTISLGLRIFPVYGPGDHGTVISKWCAEMKHGRNPMVYGDGNQSRDFIYIEDAVDQILSLIDDPKWSSRVVDIGTGVATSFNRIIEIISHNLDKKFEPVYVNRPANYSSGIICANPLPSKVPIEVGIRNILLGSKI